MTPLLAGFAAVVLTLAVLWLLWSAGRLVAHAPSRLSARHRRRGRISGDVARREWIYGERASPAEEAEGPHPTGEEATVEARPTVETSARTGASVLADTDTSAEPTDAALSEAAREAESIVRDAELRAREILASARREQMRLEQDVAREQAVDEEKRKLKELDSASAPKPENVRALDEARELRGKSSSTG